MKTTVKSTQRRAPYPKITIGVMSILLITIIAITWATIAASQARTDSPTTTASDTHSSEQQIATPSTETGNSSTEPHPSDTAAASSSATTSTNSESNTAASTSSYNGTTAPSSIESTPSSAPSQPLTPTCDEGLRTAYTNNRDTAYTAEKQRRNLQIAGFYEEANRRGMYYSGYAQSLINETQPAHDAKLATIEAQYSRNLASANCL